MLHIKAAKSVADAMGGLSKINESVRNVIGIADSVMSWRLFRRPVFPVEDWDPGRWSKQNFSQQYRLDTAIPEQHASTTAGCAFNLEIPTMFLRETLSELNEMLLVQKLAFSLDRGQHRSGIFRWLHLRRSAIKVGASPGQDHSKGTRFRHEPDPRLAAMARCTWSRLCLYH